MKEVIYKRVYSIDIKFKNRQNESIVLEFSGDYL